MSLRKAGNSITGSFSHYFNNGWTNPADIKPFEYSPGHNGPILSIEPDKTKLKRTKTALRSDKHRLDIQGVPGY